MTYLTRTPRLLAASVAVLLALAACDGGSDYHVVATFPHDTGAYTQGLVYVEGTLYESTGQYGQSDVRTVDLTTGRVLSSHALSGDRFGEGLTLLDGKLYQLTWRSGVGYIYDAATLSPIDSFTYTGQGWGLTTDGQRLIMSDGTATLRFLDPGTLAVTGELAVQDRGAPLTQINELEYVAGDVYANIYQSDWIVRIDLESGAVEQWIDLANLLPSSQRAVTDVLNGIAYDASTGHFLVTGKLWPSMFELEFPAAPELGGRQ